MRNDVESSSSTHLQRGINRLFELTSIVMHLPKGAMSDKGLLRPLRIVNGGLLIPSFPKTTELKFQEYVLCDPKGTDVQFLVQLSDARKQFVAAMEGGSPTSVIRLVSDYLPLLWRFVSSIKLGAGIRVIKPLEFEWSSAFQDNERKKAKMYTIASADVELLMVLVCFAVAHLQIAEEILGTTSGSEKQLAESAKEVNSHFLGACGIFEYILSNILPFRVLSKERPIELLQPFHVCMLKLCTMMANAIVLRKAIEESMKPLSQCRQELSFFNLHSRNRISQARFVQPPARKRGRRSLEVARR